MSPFLGLFGKPKAERNQSEEPAVLEREEMIEGIEHLSETTVKEVMVPRTDTVFIPEDAPRKEAFRILIESGHSRIPVYRESIDDVVGVLYAKDLLNLDEHTLFDPLQLMRKVPFVPETKRVPDLLKELREKKVHLAIVLDEYGGTAGLVTIEDIIEEIVGDAITDQEAKRLLTSLQERGMIDSRERLLIEVALRHADELGSSEFDVSPYKRNAIQAELLKRMLRSLALA